jgi:isohexenylglutaconyl-CoA hydratase
MLSFPECQTLVVREADGVLEVTLNRPARKNALSSAMIDELTQVFRACAGEARAIVLRGAGQTFCAGADIKDMQQASAGQAADKQRHIARDNRRLGDMLVAVQTAACPVVAVVEGAVLGGGIGLVCTSDIVLAADSARFGLPETGLGLLAAQIAPFVVQRIGLAQARRLMLTGARLDAHAAERLGLVHSVSTDTTALDAELQKTLTDIRRCAPGANARTKRFLFSVMNPDLSSVLDLGAQLFAEASVGEEADEGRSAFLEKRPPRWNV